METKVDTDAYDEQYLPNMPQIDFTMENQISNACLMIHTSLKTGDQKVPSTILSLAKGVAFNNHESRFHGYSKIRYRYCSFTLT